MFLFRAIPLKNRRGEEILRDPLGQYKKGIVKFKVTGWLGVREMSGKFETLEMSGNFLFLEMPGIFFFGLVDSIQNIKNNAKKW